MVGYNVPKFNSIRGVKGVKDVFRWTEVEEDILVQAIKESGSVREGLNKAAEVLGTSFFICRNHWYKKLQPRLAAKERQEVETSDQQAEGVPDLKDSLEGFLGGLSKMVDDNKRLVERNTYLEREIKNLMQENRELKEAYEYVLKVIERARKLALEDENRPDKVTYTVRDGVVEKVG